MTALNAHTALSVLLACSAKVTILLALAWVATYALRKRSAALRHQLWAIAVLGSLALPLLTIFLPAWHSTTLAAAAQHWQSSAFTTERLPSTSPATMIDATQNSPRLEQSVWLTLLLWTAGLVLLLIRLFAGLARLAWTSAHAEPFFDTSWMRDVSKLSVSLNVVRPVRLLRSADPAAMPVTWGLLHPRIILPAGAESWPEERRRIVLAHELAHISRHDWLLQITAEICRAVYWFHPLVWVAAGRLRQESERACDDSVLSSGVDPSRYADQLLVIARSLKNSLPAWSAALAFARPSNLERRFIAMLNPAANHQRLSSRAKLLSAIAAAVLLLPFAALRLPAQNLSGPFGGAIYDPSGAAVPNATIIMTNRQADTVDMTVSDARGNFQFKALPAGTYEMKVTKPGFQEYRSSPIVLEPARELSQNVTLELGGVTEAVDVQADNDHPTRVPSSADEASNTPRLRIGGNVEATELISKVQPIYPQAAKAAGAQGTVILHAVLGLDGRPLSIRVMNSHIDPDLARAAVEAVSKWRYTPTLLNGEPVEIDTTVMVNFTLAR
jgi:TonB family protein